MESDSTPTGGMVFSQWRSGFDLVVVTSPTVQARIDWHPTAAVPHRTDGHTHARLHSTGCIPSRAKSTAHSIAGTDQHGIGRVRQVHPAPALLVMSGCHR